MNTKEEYKFILIPRPVSMHMSLYKTNSFASKLHVDIPILIAIGLLFLISILALYSAKSDMLLLQKQIVRMFISFIFMVLVAHIPPNIFKNWSTFLYLTSLIILILVFVTGITNKGA